MTDSDRLLTALRRLTDRPDAAFREGQREAIEALLTGRGRVLVVQRTGWGKSAVYFLTTSFLRQQGLGPTLLISPLLALMRNQIEAAERLGLSCETINSASRTTVGELEQTLRRDNVDLLLISPERLANPDFAEKIMPLVGSRPGLIVIDEVHCISDWGHDFRPDYRRIGGIVDRLAAATIPILGCTATANDRVIRDVAEQLGAQLTTYRGPLQRNGLALSSLRLDRQAERLAWLDETLPKLKGSGIVYCLTVRDVGNVAAWLNTRGISVAPYFGSLDNEERLDAERRLQTNQVKAVVATSALGMGYDKPDLGFVIHFQSPGSPVAYYQQVGRAGRALQSSRAILLRGLEDEDIQNYFIETAFAPEPVVEKVLQVFDHYDGPVSLTQVQRQLNVRFSTLERIVKQLDVAGVLDRLSAYTYVRTLQPWTYPVGRVEGVAAARRAEQQAMVDYFHTPGCRMRFLADLLDDPWADDCGVCDNCAGRSEERTLPVDVVTEAERFLRQRPITIKPRKRRYEKEAGGQKAIPAVEQLEEGRALSQWGDGGWGQLVRQGKLEDRRFDRRLVDALAELIRQWQPDPEPEWVTCVPSLRDQRLVPDLTEQLAAQLALPFVPVLVKTRERPAQKTQQNSTHQQGNVEGVFELAGTPLGGPVLLVDDVVDSGWTMTEIGRLLRRSDCGPVYPVALASAAGRD